MSALFASTKSTDLTVSRLTIFTRSETMSEIPKADRANSHRGHFLGSKGCGVIPTDKRVRSPVDGVAQGILGNYAETADHSMKRLIGSQVPDIIVRRVGATLGDRLRGCGLQGSR
jgi:hypothetical protein